METPKFISSTYAVNKLDFAVGAAVDLSGWNGPGPRPQRSDIAKVEAIIAAQKNAVAAATTSAAITQPKKEIKLATPNCRLVRVLIVDPTESLKVEDRLLYKSDEIMTELTDEELFYEVSIKDLLDKHNAKRAATVDKSQKTQWAPGETPMLEPVRIRDLEMVVVEIAKFG